MRNITKIRRDFFWLRNISLVVVILLGLSFFITSVFADNSIRNQIIVGLSAFCFFLWFGLYLLCREAILRFSRARRDFLDMLEAHHDLLSQVSDEQVMDNLASTPEGILNILVKNLDAKRKESITRKVNTRTLLLENWLKANPEVDRNEDGGQWLEYNYELTTLRNLSEALKRNS